MSLKNSTALLSLGAALFAATPTLADVTGEDIWGGYQKLAATLGAELTATTERQGADFRITQVQFNLPLSWAENVSVVVDYPDMVFSDNGDGTVSADLTTEQSFGIRVAQADKPAFELEFLLSYDNAELVASGSPDQITFDYAMDGFSFRGVLPEGDGATPVKLTFEGSGSAAKGKSVVTFGEIITIDGSSKIAGMSYASDFADPKGNQSTSEVAYTDMNTQTELSLPTGGMSIMNLADALHRGLAIAVTGTYGSSHSETTSQAGGELAMSQLVKGGLSTFEATADHSGVVVTGSFADMEMDFQSPAPIPMMVKFAAESGDFDLAAPLSASEDLQDFTYAFDLRGITVGDELWAMLDPGEILPRDPMTLAARFTGKTTLFKDLFNFQDMMQLAPGEMPFDVNTLSVQDLVLSAAGAELTATGDFAFNNDDLVSFDGFPAPSGTADLSLKGANGLIDKLIQMGLITDSDAMGARMMMGMIAVPAEGEDALKSKIEITEDGKILANGQRLK